MIGIAAGAAVVFFFLKANSANDLQRIQSEKISAEQKFISAEKQIEQLRARQEYVKKTTLKREQIKKAKYKQQIAQKNID